MGANGSGTLIKVFQVLSVPNASAIALSSVCNGYNAVSKRYIGQFDFEILQNARLVGLFFSAQW
jgi:hypothetical protein